MEIWGNFFLKEESSIAEGMQELLTRGVEDLSVIEAEEIFFCGKAQRASLEEPFIHIHHFVEISEEINWQNQWELFCPYYKEGVCNIPLSDFSSHAKGQLILTPGAGFGDLSHPTTLLVMEQMAAAVEGKIVADIGCGSGVLAIFALLLGADRVFAIDIDPAALEHTRENANINHVEDRLMISTCLVHSDIDVLLLNMTFEEQKKAIAAFPLQLKAKMWITSGILQEQLAVYLSFMEEKGLVIRKVIEKEPWVCCIFST